MGAVAEERVPELRRFSREEYHRLIEAGVITEDEHVELLEGMIVCMTPQGARHAAAVSLVDALLRGLIGPGMHVRVQLPLALSKDSEPEPDVAVVAGSPRDYVHDHPRTALLVVEVADESLETDRTLKASLYAGARVPEYWVVNLRARELEVHRDPVPSSSDHPPSYKAQAAFSENDTVELSIAPGRVLSVADILP